MPELPEVEVVKRSLEKVIKNLIIKKVIINNNKLRYTVNKNDMRKIIDHKIVSLKRRSKYLLFSFDNDKIMVVHLGMTGKFFIVNNNTRAKTSFYYNLSEKDEKHNHIIFELNKKISLIYNDVRRFGFIKIIKSQKIKNNLHFNSLGPEPLKKNFNLKYFKKYLNKKTRRVIKDLLMDQKFLSGLGNIYVNEILFLSNVKPLRKINKINDFEIKKIILNTKKILKRAIISGGSSIKNFSSSSGKDGSFQQFFRVYGRNGQKCSNADCNHAIKKIKISNRASFYCNKCQK